MRLRPGEWVEVKGEAEILATLEIAKRFMGLHAEILGPDYENEAEVLQLFDMTEQGPPS